MNEFIYRTEDLKPNAILDLFVETKQDSNLLEKLSSKTPFIIEGSRGTGKSLLLKVCEQKQLESLTTETKVLPVYISFVRSSLLNSADPEQFKHWMLSSICSRILRTLRKNGLYKKSLQSVNVLSGSVPNDTLDETKLEKITKAYEDTYKNTSSSPLADTSSIPDVVAMKDAIQDICEELDFDRINILFDEAAHIFRPAQQRQFFTLFRDLRSPYITCNAAVYPGVTAYGETFQSTHDGEIQSLNRDVRSNGYIDHMIDIVHRQADSTLKINIEKNRTNFEALALAVGGNPRILLKTVALAPKMNTSQINAVFREFYRSEIWAEHSSLADRYPGHRQLIDWGRTFIKNVVIDDTNQKNIVGKKDNLNTQTCYIWVNRDASETVFEALRLLSYTGIINKMDSGVIATKSALGTRYSINMGCLVANDSEPIQLIRKIRQGLSLGRFTEYGANNANFIELSKIISDFQEADISSILTEQLEKSVQVLDLSFHQKTALDSLQIKSIGEALSSPESHYRNAHYIGPVRARKIKNTVEAAALEYLSG